MSSQQINVAKQVTSKSRGMAYPQSKQKEETTHKSANNGDANKGFTEGDSTNRMASYRKGIEKAKIGVTGGFFLTPRQLDDLKKGRRVNIYVSADENNFIGIEGAWVKLLCHYSGYAKEKLIGGKDDGLLVQGASKNVMQWIYRYMLAGEKDPEGEKPFEALDIAHLVHLYSHASVIQFQSLMDRVHGRLNRLIREGLDIPDAQTVRNMTMFLPALIEPVIYLIVNEFLQPFEGPDWLQPYYTIDDIGPLLDSTIEAELKRLIDRSIWFYSQPGQQRYSKYLDHHVYNRRDVPVEPVVQQPVVKSIKLEELTQAVEPDKNPRHRASKNDVPEHHGVPVGMDKPINGNVRIKLPVAEDSKANKLVQLAEDLQNVGVKKRGRRARKPRKKRAPDLAITIQTNTTKNSATVPTHAHSLLLERDRSETICYNYSLKGHLSRHCTINNIKELQAATVAQAAQAAKAVEHATSSPLPTDASPANSIIPVNTVNTVKSLPPKTAKPHRTCYTCGEPGHIARNCLYGTLSAKKAEAGIEFVVTDKTPEKRRWITLSISRQSLSS
ncbi:hypothetical protein B0J11DRAFT_565324 [Dendryphion nanum]|uniref:CCHC-type domain-containing protein n=1 Tax=Dendryphion nanum TaxID=256645 RepID=A0A9P9EB83_9PLEO|nr:hypothetical protein B0J11DRAFT_565324 [Dendryphion nanum]